MNFSTSKMRQLMAGAFASVAVLVVAAPANARPADSDGSGTQLRRSASSQVTVIPYLSQGVLTQADADRVYGTQADSSDVVSRAVDRHEAKEERSASWYLNDRHEPMAYSDDTTPQIAGPATREQPDGFQPQLRDPGTVRSIDDGFDWGTTGFVAGGIAAAMAVALATMFALRNRGGLRSA